MASAELLEFPQTAQALMARLPLLTLLADFQRALNDQFDSCRHVDRYRPGLALQRLRSGVALLCQLQEELLHPALGASRAEPWPALGRAIEGVGALRDLTVAGERADDARQRAVMAVLEGLAQLQFASLDELLSQADVTALRWADIERGTEALLVPWQAACRDTESRCVSA